LARFHFKLLVILVILLTLTLSTTVAASSFTDISGHWAAKAIERMSAKEVVHGYLDGSFQPNGQISNLEAITMIVRIMGLEDLALVRGSSIPPSFTSEAEVPAWGKGYVGVAVEKGIIAGEDLATFAATASAKRYQVAVYIVRAMGLEGEAEARSDANLDFVDAWNIPPLARGYIAVVEEKGIMKGGPDGRLRPHATITRAEMATLLSRVDRQLHNSLDDSEITGTVTAVGTSPASLAIRKGDGSTAIIQVAQNAAVYSGNKQVTVEEVSVGEDVTVILDEGSRAVFVEVSDLSTRTVTGVIKSVVQGTTEMLTIAQESGATSTFTLATGAQVTVDGAAAGVEDLNIGQEVSITARGETALFIEAKNPAREVSGILKAFASGPYAFVSVETDEGREGFPVADSVTVEKDGSLTSLDRLQTGDQVTLVLRGDQVVAIKAESINKELEGTMVGVAYLDSPILTIETEKGKESYPVSSDVDVERDDRTSNLTRLMPGDEIWIKVRQGEVVEIEAQSVNREVSGTIKAITIAETSSITIATSDGAEETYPVKADARIELDGETSSLNLLQIGYWAELEITSGWATRIDVETRETADQFTGTVKYVVDRSDILVVAIQANGSAAQQLREVYVDDDRTYIIKNGRLADIRDLEPGDIVTVIGTTRSGIFEASTIVVTGTAQETQD